MQWRQVWERGAKLMGLIAREFGRIPHYNAEGDRLMRAMRNHGQGERRGEPAFSFLLRLAQLLTRRRPLGGTWEVR